MATQRTLVLDLDVLLLELGGQLLRDLVQVRALLPRPSRRWIESSDSQVSQSPGRVEGAPARQAKPQRTHARTHLVVVLAVVPHQAHVLCHLLVLRVVPALQPRLFPCVENKHDGSDQPSICLLITRRQTGMASRTYLDGAQVHGLLDHDWVVRKPQRLPVHRLQERVCRRVCVCRGWGGIRVVQNNTRARHRSRRSGRIESSGRQAQRQTSGQAGRQAGRQARTDVLLVGEPLHELVHLAQPGVRHSLFDACKSAAALARPAAPLQLLPCRLWCGNRRSEMESIDVVLADDDD